MTASELFMITSSPFLSGLIWFVLVVTVLFVARTHAHMGIKSLCRVVHNAMRITANSVMHAEKTLMQRNSEVLLAQGREAAERIVEREFDRVDATVRRDLAEYPALHRQLSEEITRIDEDYKESTEVPPTPPAWVKAVEAVAKIPSSKGDPMVGNVLEDIHQSLIKANTKATEEYRKSSHERHELLKGMMPQWRKVKQILDRVDKNINSLLTRSVTIDRHMDEYESIVKGTDRAERMLSSSSLTQFFISGLVLAIAIGGAMINFHLIARPMSEMVGGTNQIMGFQINNIAAMVIILIEMAMGIFLMESLRITRLFPIIGALNDKTRIRMVWAFFAMLFFLACVEAGLAFMREILMEEDAATRALLRDGEAAAVVSGSSYLWITTAAQMGMGFILPFALMFVAIPLESFVHSLRTVLGVMGVAALRGLAWFLRLLGNVAKFTGLTLVHIYDLIIFAPLWIEKQVKDNKQNKTATDEDFEPEKTVNIRGVAQ
ncbi:MAG: hypothetical protein PVJ63_06270 [Thioalkalispiraceae bacterium]